MKPHKTIYKKFSIRQLNRISEIFGNVSVAWFSVGVISSVVDPPSDLVDFLVRLGISLTMAVLFFYSSLKLIE